MGMIVRKRKSKFVGAPSLPIGRGSETGTGYTNIRKLPVRTHAFGLAFVHPRSRLDIPWNPLTLETFAIHFGSTGINADPTVCKHYKPVGALALTFAAVSATLSAGVASSSHRHPRSREQSDAGKPVKPGLAYLGPSGIPFLILGSRRLSSLSCPYGLALLVGVSTSIHHKNFKFCYVYRMSDARSILSPRLISPVAIHSNHGLDITRGPWT